MLLFKSVYWAKMGLGHTKISRSQFCSQSNPENLHINPAALQSFPLLSIFSPSFFFRKPAKSFALWGEKLTIQLPSLHSWKVAWSIHISLYRCPWDPISVAMHFSRLHQGFRWCLPPSEHHSSWAAINYHHFYHQCLEKCNYLVN